MRLPNDTLCGRADEQSALSGRFRREPRTRLADIGPRCVRFASVQSERERVGTLRAISGVCMHSAPSEWTQALAPRPFVKVYRVDAFIVL